MTHESISEISFTQVRKLVQEDLNTDETMDSIDSLLGAIIAVSPVVLGPIGFALLPLIDAKNELMRFGKILVGKLTATDDDYLGRSERMAAANCLITFTSFFEALSRTLPELTAAVSLSPTETRTQCLQACRRLSSEPNQLTDKAIALPHPADDLDDELRVRTELYMELTDGFVDFMSGLKVWETAEPDYRDSVASILENLPVIASEIYQDQYLALAAEYHTFFVWADFYEHTKTQRQTNAVSKELKRQVDLFDSVDQGLKLLQTAVREISIPTGVPTVEAALEGLRRTYAHNISKPVIDDQFPEAAHELTQLGYPRKGDAFIPQAFKILRSATTGQSLEDERLWAPRKPQNGLGPFVVQHLESAYGAEELLLVLGHPGSGKSLLPEMLAARLASGFSTIRVELRDIDTEPDLQSQIEHQIRSDTGYDVSWPQFSAALSDTPPLVILDGFDELLQASGKAFSHYLLDVERFQHRERILGRPVRIMVTSRITLIDKAAMPPGTTVLRLLEFDEPRRTLWVDQWNNYNQRYFADSGVAPFVVPDNHKVLQLAEQPLLLLMLAVYDSAANQLSRNPNIDQTLLYYSLLIRFIERERRKGQAGLEFASLPQPKQSEAIDDDLERLGVAAIGMFNRQTLHIQREQLDADIGYFGLVRQAPDGTGRRLTQADLLLGSFFFIHESKSRSSDPELGVKDQPTAFEFLHNTFGEFLAADFILRQVVKQTATIDGLSTNKALASTLEQHLEGLEDHWFACLIYTPLHTRPVILGMLREWFAHKISDAGRSEQAILSELDTIIYRQLKTILFGTPPAPIMKNRAETPYEPLPLLGHIATYTLNLILLRTVIARPAYTFDESALGVANGSCRPWDRLIQLWRSWLPLENLVGVAAIINAARIDHALIVQSAAPQESSTDRSRLNDVFAVADALGDDVLCALAGISTYRGHASQTAVIDGAVERLALDNIRLAPHWTALRARWGIKDLRHPLQDAQEYLDGPISEPYGPGLLEAITHERPSLELLGTIRIGGNSFDAFAQMSRYETALWIKLKNNIEPRWLPSLFSHGIISDPFPAIDVLVTSPAGAPLLQAAVARTLNPAIEGGVAHLSRAESVERIRSCEFLDLETAAAMAMLAASHNSSILCDTALRAALTGIIDHGWHVNAISLGYLRILAGALKSGVADSRLVAEVRAVITQSINAIDSDFTPSMFEALIEITRVVNSDAFISTAIRHYDNMMGSHSNLIGDIELMLTMVQLARELERPDILDPIHRIFGRVWGRGDDRRIHPSRLSRQELDDLRWAAEYLPEAWLSDIVDGESGGH